MAKDNPRIFLCGDTHGMIDFGKVEDYFADLVLYDEVSKDDYLIILGDTSVLWDGGNQDREVQEALSNLPVTVLWLDGNHENFDLIYDYPDEEWHGGLVHIIRDDIIHLMRGQVYTIGGQTFFTFGGGNSIDKAGRTPGISWWPQEMPNDDEYEEGLRNLEKHGNRVDYVLTHSCPRDIAGQLVTYLYPGEETLQKYLDEVAQNTEFEEWYFGHWHLDDTIGNYRCLFNEVIELEW